jgi:hypothetical protein
MAHPKEVAQPNSCVGLHWQTCPKGLFDPERLFGLLANRATAAHVTGAMSA